MAVGNPRHNARALEWLERLWKEPSALTGIQLIHERDWITHPRSARSVRRQGLEFPAEPSRAILSPGDAEVITRARVVKLRYCLRS